MHFHQGSMAKARGDISKQEGEKILKTTPSRLSKVKNLQKPLIVLFPNVILKTFQVKIKNQVMIAQRKILKTFQMKAKNHVMVLARRKILKVKNLQRLLIAMIQNVMMLNFSQVKKMI
jgi:hypothetical protein